MCVYNLMFANIEIKSRKCYFVFVLIATWRRCDITVTCVLAGVRVSVRACMRVLVPARSSGCTYVHIPDA